MSPKEIKIPTDYVTFSGLELGDPDGQPVLALHGWMDNAASFIPMSQCLKGIKLIAVDLAGHGRSDWRAEGGDYCHWNYTDDIVKIMEALGFKQIAIVGHSLGAIIAVMLAASLPDRVKRLVLVDGLCPMPAEASRAPKLLAEYLKAKNLSNNKKLKKGYDSLEAAVMARVQGRFPLSQKAAELLVQRAIVENEGKWCWRTDPRLSMPSPVRMTMEQSLAFPQALTCESHLFYSRQGLMDHLVSEFSEKLDHIQLHSFEGSHHFHMEEQAIKVAEMMNGLFGTSKK